MVAPAVAAVSMPCVARDGHAWTAFAVTAAVTGQAGAPALSWLDSGELVAAARELGGIHPPGHPAWLSLAGLAEALPLGPYAGRLAWLSALFAGLSAFLVVRLARLALRDVPVTLQNPARERDPFALAAGLVFAAGASLWHVAVRPEVYTLALASNLLAIYAGVRAGDAARAGNLQPTLAHLATAAVAVCLGLLNHHYVTLFALPAVTVAAWPALGLLVRKHRRWLVFLLLGMAWLGVGYLALVLRARADTELRWGDPRTWQGLWDTLTARHFQKSVTETAVPIGDHALVLLGMVGEGLGAVGALAGGLGLCVGWLRRDRLQVALWLALVGALMTKALMQIDTRNPDDHGYVLLVQAALAVGVAQLAGIVLPRLAEGKGRTWVARLAQFGLGMTAAVLLLQHAAAPATNLGHLRAPDAIDSQLRRTLAPGSLYLSNYYGLAYNEQAFRVAEGRRPDTVAVHLSFRTGDTDGGLGFQTWFARRHPDFRDLAVAAARLGRLPVGNVLARVEKQPVYGEQDPAVRIPAPFFSFDGTAHRLMAEQERALDYDPAGVRERSTGTWRALYTALGPDALADHPTRAVLLWQHALQAAHALRRGWLLVAQDELDRGLELNPTDRTLARLQARHGALDAAWKRADVKAYQNLWQRYGTMDFDALAGLEP